MTLQLTSFLMGLVGLVLVYAVVYLAFSLIVQTTTRIAYQVVVELWAKDDRKQASAWARQRR